MSSYNYLYYTLRFYFPYLSLLAKPVNILVYGPVNILVYRPGPINIIHLLHAGEGNMKMYSPKSIIFPEGIARGEYDTRG